jgi:hypothetical protein
MRVARRHVVVRSTAHCPPARRAFAIVSERRYHSATSLVEIAAPLSCMTLEGQSEADFREFAPRAESVNCEVGQLPCLAHAIGRGSQEACGTEALYEVLAVVTNGAC